MEPELVVEVGVDVARNASGRWRHPARWHRARPDQTIHDLLRWQVREKARRKADPSLVVVDTQSVHAAAGVPAESTGCDAAKKYRAASAAWPLTFWAW